jgi:redox-sensitive bicupin YhaK (pirin superfamily)
MAPSPGNLEADVAPATDVAADTIHLAPDDYHVIRPEDFGAPGLWARESVGPFVPIQAIGTLVTVHDSRFDPGRGIGHHPHQGMERLFYIMEGGVDHDDALNGITGHMATGDLGILTEGRRGMVHSEWNHEDELPTRAYILVYPTDPTPPTASFDAIRDAEAPRVEPAPGVVTKQVVAGGSDQLHGDLRAFADTALEEDATLAVDVGGDEAALVFVLDGTLEAHDRDGNVVAGGVGRDHTVLLAPAPRGRQLRLAARRPARVLHTVTGRGFGLRRRG